MIFFPGLNILNGQKPNQIFCMSKKLLHKFQDEQAARMGALAKRKGLVGGWVPVGRHIAPYREWRQYVRDFMPHTLTQAQPTGGFQPGAFLGFTNTRTVNRMLGGRARRRRRRAPVRGGAAKRAAVRKRAYKRRRYAGTGRRRRRAPVRRRGRGLRGGAWGDRTPVHRAPAAAPAVVVAPPRPVAVRVPVKKSGMSTAAKAALATLGAFGTAGAAYLGYKNRSLPGSVRGAYERQRTWLPEESKARSAWNVAQMIPQMIRFK